jgi:hypothetical protein
MNDAREALYYFEMVTKRDPAYLDANDRLSRLRSGASAQKRKAASEDSDASVDALLDEI